MQKASNSIASLRAWARAELSHLSELEEPDFVHPETLQFEIDELLCFIAGESRASMLARGERELSASQTEQFKQLVERRGKFEPLGYLLGRVPFHEIELVVSPSVLIPRSETEFLVERALAILSSLSEPAVVLDVGLGSGAILLAIASALRASLPGEVFAQFRFIGAELSPEALKLAKENAQALGLSSSVCCVESDLLAKVPRIDSSGPVLIVSNPPYIANEELLPRSVEDFEPRLALRAGETGMDIVERLLSEVGIYLKQGAVLLLELGYRQDSLVKSALRKFGDYPLVFHQDLRGINRIAEVRGHTCENFFLSLGESV